MIARWPRIVTAAHDHNFGTVEGVGVDGGRLSL